MTYLLKLAEITTEEYAEAVLIEEGKPGVEAEYFRQLEKQNLSAS
jgi:hypothetical protein